MKDILPIRAIAGSIIFARDGSRWAVFRVTAHEYGLRSRDDKLATRTAHKELVNLLPNNSMFLSVQSPMSMRSIARSMATDPDLKRFAGYFSECKQKLNELDQYSPFERTFYVIAPLDRTLADSFGASRVRESIQAWRTGDATAHVSQDMIADARELAEELRRTVSPGDDSSDAGSGFRLTPVTPAEIDWIWNQAATRGAIRTPRPDFRGAPSDKIITRDTMTRVVTDVGATTDPRDRKGMLANLASRVFHPPAAVVKVNAFRAADGQPAPASYQSFLVAETFPMKPMPFPGGTEIFDLIDEAERVVDGHPVIYDWVLRFTKHSRERTQAENIRNLQKIGDQLDERAAEMSFAANSLTAKAHNLTEFNNRIENDALEFAVHFTPIVAIGSASKTATLSAAEQLATKFRRRLSIKMVDPARAQLDLMAMTIPGSAFNRVIDDYAQTTTSIDFAELAPFHTATVGDGVGPVAAINLSSGNYEPVHFDLAGATAADSSSCVAVVGELGGGKSYFIKTLIYLVHLLNGQHVTIDRTAPGEYDLFSHALTDTQTVDFESPRYRVDPLVIFDAVVARGRRTPEQVVDLTGQVLASLFNLGNTSVEAHLLATQLDHSYRAKHGIRSTRDLANHTIELAKSPDSTDACQRLAHLHTIWIPRAPAIYDDALPPLDLDASGIVFRTHGLSLPSKDEMRSPVAFEHMELAKRKGQVYYTLAARIAREVLFGPERFGLLVADEAHHFDDTVAGEILCEFIRDGRKNNAGMVIGSHDAENDFPPVVRELIPYRILFRHRDHNLARKGLEYIGADLEAYPWLVKELTTHTSPLMPSADGGRPKTPMHRRGEAYLRDAQQRLSRIKVLGPSDPLARLAVSSTPDDLARLAAMRAEAAAQEAR